MLNTDFCFLLLPVSIHQPQWSVVTASPNSKEGTRTTAAKVLNGVSQNRLIPIFPLGEP